MTTPNATEREIARQIASHLNLGPPDRPDGASSGSQRIAFENAIYLIATVLADRREACARKADGFTCGSCGMDGKAGAAIREMED